MAVPLMPLAPGNPDYRQLGVFYGMYALSVLAVTPVFGAFGDCIGSRRTLLCGIALGALSSLCFAIGTPIYVLSFAKLLQGAASAASWTAGLAMIAERYRTNRAEMLGYAYTGSTAGSVLGPLLGGFIHSAFGYSPPFALAGGLYLIAAGVLLAVPETGQRSTDPIDWRALLLNSSQSYFGKLLDIIAESGINRTRSNCTAATNDRRTPTGNPCWRTTSNATTARQRIPASAPQSM